MLKEGDKKRIIEFILLFLIFIIIILFIYFVVYKDIFLLFTQECKDSDCFNFYLSKCRRAQYTNDEAVATWVYTIKGKSEGKCEVEVKLLVIKEGKIDLSRAEGKEMLCYLPYGVVAKPGDELSRCTGQLKEELQDLIIKRLHSNIYENMQEILDDLSK